MKVLFTKPSVKFPILFFILLATTIIICSIQQPIANTESTDTLSIAQVEKRLLDGNYSQTLSASFWAAKQGPSIVPILDDMLAKTRQYKQERSQVTGAFPFNAVWALAHIDSPMSIVVLEKYYATMQDDIALLAISGIKLRQEMGSHQYGVIFTDSDKIFSDLSLNSPVIQVVIKGQQVKILRTRIENPNETNGRGGIQTFDYVELAPSGIRGFIARRGDDFPPFI